MIFLSLLDGHILVSFKWHLEGGCAKPRDLIGQNFV